MKYLINCTIEVPLVNLSTVELFKTRDVGSRNRDDRYSIYFERNCRNELGSLWF